MVLRRRLLTNLLLGAAVVVASVGSLPAAASTGSAGQTRQIAAGGTAVGGTRSPLATGSVGDIDRASPQPHASAAALAARNVRRSVSMPSNLGSDAPQLHVASPSGARRR